MITESIQERPKYLSPALRSQAANLAKRYKDDRAIRQELCYVTAATFFYKHSECKGIFATPRNVVKHYNMHAAKFNVPSLSTSISRNRTLESIRKRCIDKGLFTRSYGEYYKETHQRIVYLHPELDAIDKVAPGVINCAAHNAKALLERTKRHEIKQQIQASGKAPKKPVNPSNGKGSRDSDKSGHYAPLETGSLTEIKKNKYNQATLEKFSLNFDWVKKTFASYAKEFITLSKLFEKNKDKPGTMNEIQALRMIRLFSLVGRRIPRALHNALAHVAHVARAAQADLEPLGGGMTSAVHRAATGAYERHQQEQSQAIEVAAGVRVSTIISEIANLKRLISNSLEINMDTMILERTLAREEERLEGYRNEFPGLSF
ncbi:hypothetical protein [Thaumasiovibrio sp. DFM-14]|uniref:hypothetical protein n=1 Tax=Thaumasiovibrio sp. DFM-14 TaxID=3384792 RepID=UPI0039A1097D